MCISIVWTKKHYFLFDSHSKNENGETCPNGYSVLIKFTKKTDLESHIIKNYLNLGDVGIQFELQYINISKESDENVSKKYLLFRKRE